MRRTPPIALAVLAACAAGAPVAHAEYGPGAEPASADGARLGSLGSRTPTLSDDGRYVAFDTDAPELLGAPPDPAQRFTRGLVRRDLRTGAVALVAPPRRARADDGTVLADGATGIASLSGNGRYVVFETTEPLVPGDQNGALDVYVRDMDGPLSEAASYTLVSALDGSDAAADYAGGGSRVGPAGFALSDDGRTAVYWTSGRSNLPAGGAIATPAGQVLVRALDTRRTQLMTRDAAGTPVPEPDGALPVPVLSGDGGTVAWLDRHPAPQVPLLAGEPEPAAALLWRRLADGPAAPAHRVGGATDPENPACAPGTPFAPGDGVTGPCYGPFVLDAGVDGNNDRGPITGEPSLSDDGRRLLLLSTAKRRPYDAASARAAASLYLADLTPGLPRAAAVVRAISLTGANAAIGAAVLTGDGRHAVLTTSSVTFDGPRTIGALPAPGTGATDVWVADLGAGTVQRATTGFDGADFHGPPIDPENPNAFADPAPTAPTADDDARALAFSAGDGNLFIGDANGVPDVQVVRGAAGVAATAQAALTRPVPAPLDAASVRLAPVAAPPAVHPVIGFARVGADGVARLAVRVPAAGRLTATATARLRGETATVARARRAVTRGPLTVTLRLAPRAAARRVLGRARLRATIRVRYVPRAGAETIATRTVTYPRRRAR